MAEPRAGLFQLDRDAETSPRRLAILIAGGVVALLLLLWLFRDDPPVSADTERDPAAAPPVATPAPAPVETASPVAPAVSVAALRLHGVMGTGEDGSAIVSDGAGPQRLVRVGRDVLPGVPLLAVAADHILIRENGREVRLAFSEDGDGAVTASAAPRSGNGSGLRGSEAERREAREYQAAVTSFRVDGRHAGYRFREGRMPEIFQQAGIRSDDVIVRVGGLRLEDDDAVAGIPERIRERGRVEIEILRDGREETIIMDAR
ncbi:MAG: type II secretion system protein N [Parasphingopyxis sp.]|uniref:type II secretion system protein N n=1 Tax=Parasphingopyxis sp. TaxID=1920299 RepID=UPI003FA0E755